MMTVTTRSGAPSPVLGRSFCEAELCRLLLFVKSRLDGPLDRPGRVRVRKAMATMVNLLDHADEATRRRILHVVAVPWAGPEVAAALAAQLRRRNDASPQTEAIAEALRDVVADPLLPPFLPVLIGIARDERLGRARQPVVERLGTAGGEGVFELLLGLLTDDSVAGAAARALGARRDDRAVSALRNLATHPRPWVSREAQNALQMIWHGPDHPAVKRLRPARL